MSELPVVGFLCLRKDFWDHHGANIATCLKEILAKGFFDVQKTIMERDQRFFAAVLSQIINNDVDAKDA